MEKNILVVPRHKVFLRFIKVPSTDDVEIRKMAVLRSIKEVPFPKDDIIAACRNLGVSKDGFSSVMLAIAKQDMICDMVRGHIISNPVPDSVRLDTELFYLALRRKGIVSEGGADLLISIGKDYSELMITDNQRPVFSRSFKNSRRFLREIDYSIRAYKKDRGSRDPGAVTIACRPGVDIGNLKLTIERHFTKPVNFYEFKGDLFTEHLSAEIDLMPGKIVEKKSTALRKAELAFTCLLAGLIVMLSAVFMYLKIDHKQAILDSISSRLEIVKPRVNMLERHLKRVSFFEEEERRAGILNGIISGSYNPGQLDIFLSDFRYDGDKNLYFKGTAGEMSIILAFVKRLKESGYFDLVEIRRATKDIVNKKERAGFDIHGRIKI